MRRRCCCDEPPSPEFTCLHCITGFMPQRWQLTTTEIRITGNISGLIWRIPAGTYLIDVVGEGPPLFGGPFNPYCKVAGASFNPNVIGSCYPILRPFIAVGYTPATGITEIVAGFFQVTSGSNLVESMQLASVAAQQINCHQNSYTRVISVPTQPPLFTTYQNCGVPNQSITKSYGGTLTFTAESL